MVQGEEAAYKVLHDCSIIAGDERPVQRLNIGRSSEQRQLHKGSQAFVHHPSIHPTSCELQKT